jgi:hypothetical protein
MILKHHIDIVEYKPLRSSPRIRILLDVGEMNPDQIKSLHEMLMLGEQKLSVLIAPTEDFNQLKGLEETEDDEYPNDAYV